MTDTKLSATLYDIPHDPASGRRYQVMAHLVEVAYTGSLVWWGRFLDVPVSSGQELLNLVNRPIAALFEDRRQGLVWCFRWQMTAPLPEGEEPPPPEEARPDRAHLWFVGLTSLEVHPAHR